MARGELPVLEAAGLVGERPARAARLLRGVDPRRPAARVLDQRLLLHAVVPDRNLAELLAQVLD